MTSIPEFGANPKYPYYEKGVTQLPPDIKPPLDEYTNMEMAGIAGEAAVDYLVKSGVDETFAHETASGVVAFVNAWFEKNLTEWRLTGLVDRQKFPDEEHRFARINFEVNENHRECGRAAIEAVKGSPLMARGKEYVVAFARTVGNAVADHIEKLKTYPDAKE
jgi:hypothetical protein